jgi:hypothetical protein
MYVADEYHMVFDECHAYFKIIQDGHLLLGSHNSFREFFSEFLPVDRIMAFQ